MGLGLKGISGPFGRAASFAVAMLAVLTLVASGGFHEMLHADEPSGVQTAQTLDRPSAADQAPASVRGETAARQGLPIHACSGHCAAHAADQPPLLIALAEPATAAADWDQTHAVRLTTRASGGLERPPRA